MADLIETLLTRAGMEAAQRALKDRYRWFLHVGRLDDIESYRTNGIEPRNPDLLGKLPGPDQPGKPAPDLFARLLEGFVGKPEEIVCLRPIDTLDTTPTRPGAKFAMALRADDLPPNVSLDWSFGGVVALARDQQRVHLHWNPEHIFVDVAHRRGSIAVYDRIPASVLYVLAKGSNGYDPATWSRLKDVAIADIQPLP